MNFVSVKISSMVSQIHLVGVEGTLEAIRDRLRRVYRVAMENPTGEGKAKLVCLDMEEYRDLDLTLRAFCSVLDEEEFAKLEAGVVLQAYLPDSFERMGELFHWAAERKAEGGVGIRVRLVKGANLAMEKVEAAHHGWPQAPYGTKEEVDANFKRMLRFGCSTNWEGAVTMGVASHNVFDLAYAQLLRQERACEDEVAFEMLEGMAPGFAKILARKAGGVLLYAPVVSEQEFPSAMAYLVRRFDEQTTAGNFLADSFGLTVGSEAWKRQRTAFLQACRLSFHRSLEGGPRRTQNRLKEVVSLVEGEEINEFANEPDTDFSLSANQQWIQEVIERWADRPWERVSASIGGQRPNIREERVGRDPSTGEERYRYAVGGCQEVELAVESAKAAQPGWEELGWERRGEILRQVAARMMEDRGEMVGCLMLDGAKAALEGDREVSEAIDFARYYATCDERWAAGELQPQARGTIVVAPPWNFPYAIAAGGCLAALQAGNAVILKPAPETVLTGWMLARQLWEAGVPEDILQFLPLADGAVGRRLITHPGVDGVVLTGSSQTARTFLRWNPGSSLWAETSGKNAMVITAAADLDQAVLHLVQSAFGHAGQKCSAASLALVERSVYEDASFAEKLRDAAASLTVARAWKPSAIVTPLVQAPSEGLRRGLSRLEGAQSWLLRPERQSGSPHLWSPGVRWGVEPDHPFFFEECFGPVLGVVPVKDLGEAIHLQNGSRFGLTGGIQSLDEEEIEQWTGSVEVGNAYVNRPTTGAVVGRQPFGGWKESSFGTGAKAGGPNYVSQFAKWESPGPLLRIEGSFLREEEEQMIDLWRGELGSADEEWLRRAAESDAFWWKSVFSQTLDPTPILGERNGQRYVPRSRVFLRAAGDAPLTEIARVCLAMSRTGQPVQLSVAHGETRIPETLTTTKESIDALESRLRLQGGSWLVRWIGSPPSAPTRRRLLDASVFLVTEDVSVSGRVELAHWMREQCVSESRHRYGNLVRSE
ncbi:MAG: bifunctional proline dehydrogenase/L-glutamate gamma-semialdehyde dehydrogenase [Verrucomicrobiota bacterium]